MLRDETENLSGLGHLIIDVRSDHLVSRDGLGEGDSFRNDLLKLPDLRPLLHDFRLQPPNQTVQPGVIVEAHQKILSA